MEQLFSISSTFIGIVQGKVNQANRRAEKQGWPKIELETVDERWIYPEGYPLGIKMLDVVMRSHPLKFDGWRFVASLEAGAIGNIVKSAGEDVPEKFRSDDMRCDHCGTIRRRNVTYVLAHDDGTYKQVGSACIKDFLGGHERQAELYAQWFDGIWELATQASDWDEMERSGSGGYRPDAWESATVLAMTCRVVREFGWVSRRAAEDSYGDKIATVSHVQDQFALGNSERDRAKRLEIEEPDWVKAGDVLAWLRNLAERSNLSSYEWNLVNVASLDEVSSKNMGILASGVAAYNRAMEREDALRRKADQATSEYQGTVGQRQEFGPLTVKFVREFDGKYGTTHLHVMEDAHGNQFAWWASSEGFDEGDVVQGKGTVKKHEISKFGERQTVLTRCKFEVLEPV